FCFFDCASLAILVLPQITGLDGWPPILLRNGSRVSLLPGSCGAGQKKCHSVSLLEKSDPLWSRRPGRRRVTDAGGPLNYYYTPAARPKRASLLQHRAWKRRRRQGWVE